MGEKKEMGADLQLATPLDSLLRPRNGAQAQPFVYLEIPILRLLSLSQPNLQLPKQNINSGEARNDPLMKPFILQSTVYNFSYNYLC